MTRQPIVIGGGPAGAIAALTLRQTGQPVMVIERSIRAPEKLCGDFLGASAIRSAESFGVDPFALGGHNLTRLRLIRRERVVETALPFRALGLSRAVFDDALLARAAMAGADIVCGQAVRAVHQDGPDLIVTTDNAENIETGTVFLGTGRHDLGGFARPGRGVGPTVLKVTLRPRHLAALTGWVELVRLPGGHACLHRVGDDLAVLCAVLFRWDDDPAPASLFGRLLAHNAHLAERLDGAETVGAPIGATGMPFGFLHRPRSVDHDGLYRIGDQAAMLGSMIGDGVSVAMRTGARAAQAWLTGAGANEYHRRLRGTLWPRTRFSAVLTPTANRTEAANPPQRLTAHWTEPRA